MTSLSDSAGGYRTPTTDSMNDETPSSISGTPVMHGHDLCADYTPPPNIDITVIPAEELTGVDEAVQTPVILSSAAAFNLLNEKREFCGSPSSKLLKTSPEFIPSGNQEELCNPRRDDIERSAYLKDLKDAVSEQNSALSNWLSSCYSDYDFDMCVPARRFLDIEERTRDLRVITDSPPNDIQLDITGGANHH